MEEKSVSWVEFNELRRKNVMLQKKLDELQGEKSHIPNKHSPEFWYQIHHKCLTDVDYVKALVKNKTLTMYDTNISGKTLLIMVAWRGSYELTQFCINQGADVYTKDQSNKTALDRCRENGFHHIEQLLLFSTMNINVGNEIKNVSEAIHKQNGINKNISTALTAIGDQSKQLFEKTLIELMIALINERLSFDDTLLNLCWNIVSRDGDPLSSELWKAITATSSAVIQNGKMRDWHWLKRYIIPSTLWYKKDEKSSNYLYYELLRLVDVEAKRQLNDLENDLNILANENKDVWNKLTVYDIPNQYEKVRQDVIPNGIVSRYTYNQLSESSGVRFNSPRFYDYNQYLSQLVLLAQIVDDDFQRSIQDMFGVDKITNIANLYDIYDEGNRNETTEKIKRGNGEILYQRGPVKLIERARHKAQNDYANEDYPASACILDLNRCALIFHDISTMLATLELFVNKVKYYQSGNIIGIVRDKNGFIEYLKQPQYADVKLNVLIRGRHNNIIGEVQFLLNRMKSFKDKAHNLYAIQRQQESVETSVKQILPLLLDFDKRIFIAGNGGNVKQLCEIMATSSKSINDLMIKDPKSGGTILQSICKLGHAKAFRFLRSALPKEQFVKYALELNAKAKSPTDWSFQEGQVQIVKGFLDMEEIRNFYRNNDEGLYRFCNSIFAYNTNEDLTDYVLKLLKISNKDVQKIMFYKYTAKTKKDIFATSIMERLVIQSTIKELKKLVSIIGEKVFCDAVFTSPYRNWNSLLSAIRRNKVEIVRFMLETEGIKNKYLNELKELHLMFGILNREFNEAMASCIVENLKLTQTILDQLQSIYKTDVSKVQNLIL